MRHAESIAVDDRRTGAGPGSWRARAWLFARVALVALFLAMVARTYIRGAGFTALIRFAADSHSLETPTVQATPHVHSNEHGGYDGQYYAQIAVDPLLRDPAIDRAMDRPAYRGRRILFCWTAYLAGLGRPFWVLQAYALENVVSWLALAWLLHRRFPRPGAKSLAVWAGCLFTHGLMISTRCALVDGPSLLLIALAVGALERQRPLAAAVVLGCSGLARETNLFAIPALPLPWPPHGRALARAAGRLAIVLLPLAVWVDYLRSIYRSAVFRAGDLFNVPGDYYVKYWKMTVGHVRGSGVDVIEWGGLLALVAITAQAAFLLARPRWRQPWWRVGVGYIVLMLLLDRSVWEGNPGAFTRVLLPMQVAFNVLVADSPGFWPLFVIGNLSLVPAVFVLARMP